MPVNYDDLKPVAWTDPRMEWPWRVVRMAMPVCCPEVGLTVRPDYMPFIEHLVTFRIMCELMAQRLEAELRRPVVVEIHPDKCVFKFLENA